MRHRAPAFRFLRAALAGSALAAPALADAQYFGRNKVQYETFDFRVLKTPKFDVHYYPAESLVAHDAGRMAERWYARHSRTLGHSFGKRSLIFYADHPDFEQTNVIGGFIDQSTGGVTESLRGRVVMPFSGVYADDDHVLGHEIVHVFQYDIAAIPSTGGMRGLQSLPLWLIEGMAEYLSVGRDDPHTAMWMRDAARRNDLPSIRQLTNDPRYFPYRYGQALWAYIGGRWGDSVITSLYRGSIRQGWDPAVRRILGVSSDTLSAQWLQAIREAYLPVMQGRTGPREIGERILPRENRQGEMDISPSLSPDGRRIAFFSRRGLLGIDLFIADVETGRIEKKLTSPNVDQHFDAISFINSSGSWSPDGRRFAFIVFARGDNELAIYNVDDDRVERRLRVRGVGQITDPSWGANDQIVFSGSAGGVSDLYLLDMRTGQVRQLTDDRYADLQPSWSPDGRTIAFSSDRGPETDFERLTYGPMLLSFMDAGSGTIRTVPVFEGAKHINPQWAPDGGAVFFVSDRGGFSDVYRLALGAAGAPGAVTQVTRLATGVSGITSLSPALTVARLSGRMAMSVFDKGGNSLRRLEAAATAGEPVAPLAPGAELARMLPPVQPVTRSLVALALGDPVTGLPEAGGDRFLGRPYAKTLRLDYIGSPGVGFAAGGGQFAIYGGAIGYFADMLNDRVLGAALMVNGRSFKDAGGEIVYYNQRRRWNWATGLSHTPYYSGFAEYVDTTYNGQPATNLRQEITRIYVDQAMAQVQYPFSQTRRFESSVSLNHLGYDTEVENLIVDPFTGVLIDQYIDDADSPPGATYGQVSAAFVGDYSFFGFTSPIAGGRWRFEVSPTVGDYQFQSLLADYRRYLFFRPLTFAVRGMGFAQVGRDADNGNLQPNYLGHEQLIRGYNLESFSVDECSSPPDGSSGSCPEFDRLIGTRIAVANVELRIPLFGTQDLGLLNFPFLPTEVSPFFDAGVAWNKGDSPDLAFRRETAARVPVFSAGISARVNLLGYAVGEIYWAYPFQRPQRGGHFGMQLAPGW